MMWRVCHITIYQGLTSRLALIHVYCLAFVLGMPKVRISTVQRYWLISLAPTNEESAWLNEEKTLIG
jgi:hypothetical protein